MHEMYSESIGKPQALPRQRRKGKQLNPSGGEGEDDELVDKAVGF